MDKFKEKLAALRVEVDNATARADKAESEVKVLQDEQIQKDHEITSLKNRLTRAEEDLEKAENRIAEAKLNLDEGETTKTVGEGLARKVSLLETELDAAERNLRDTTEKLRQMDIKAEHFERKVVQLETDRDNYERKVEDLTTKYNGIKLELDETINSLNDM
ncbi:tropomyosin, fungi type [Entomortierella parvispora]|uniref:Tropomyosin, fungi type n=1 Tax=Entomortierella parvispora TaxID=205924 RepID=A0A9P3HLQ9_9FUNG|nr:tropomyosin, fungi type [Entomortierella parvispora]